MFTTRFDDALTFAHGLHRRQKRKTSGVPYIGHPLGVAALVIEDGGSEDEAIAALLHDTLEDQGRGFPGGVPALAEEIERRFGAEVRRIVEACTEGRSAEEIATTDKRERFRLHKESYFALIRNAGAAVRRVSCADSLHNVRTMTKDYQRMGEKLWTRFMTRRGDDQIWAYSTLAATFLATGTEPLAHELERAVRELREAANGGGAEL